MYGMYDLRLRQLLSLPTTFFNLDLVVETINQGSKVCSNGLFT